MRDQRGRAPAPRRRAPRRARRALEPVARRAAVQRARHQHEPAGRELARRRPRAAGSARRRRGRRPAAAARTTSRQKPAITSAIHSGVYGWRGRSSESPCSGRSGSTSRKRSDELLDQRLPLAVGQQRRVQQRERRPGARLAVGDPRAVVVVVEAELHTLRSRRRCAHPTTARSSALAAARARRAGGRAALRARRHRDRRPPRHDPARGAGDRGDGAELAPSRSSTSSPTARPRRSRGCTAPAATRRRRRSASQALWLGARRSASCCCWSRSRSPRPVARADGRRGRDRSTRRVLYLRIAALGAPFFMLAARRPGLPARDRRPAHAAGDPGRRAQRQRRARAAVRLRLRLGARGLGVGHGDRAGRAWARAFVRVQRARRAGSRRDLDADPLADADRRRDRGAHDRAARLVPRRLGRAGAGRRRRRSARTRSRSSCSSSSRSCSTRSRSPAQVMVGRMLGAGDAGRARAPRRCG